MEWAGDIGGVSLEEVDEMWRIVECETLLWVRESSLGKLRDALKGYERGCDRGADMMVEVERYVEKLMFFLDSNDCDTSDVYKKLVVEYEDCVGEGGDFNGSGFDFPFTHGDDDEGILLN